MLDRREFIKTTAAAAAVLPTFNILKAGHHKEFKVHQFTEGEKQHWMGYYDKWQTDLTGRYAVGNQVDMIFRSPSAQDTLKIGLIDLEDDNKWKTIGTSTAWGWQQGCMLQFIPGSSEEVIWNDHNAGNGFLSKVYNINTGKTRTLPRAIYTLSPDGKFALCVDFDRLQFYRPGYGYPTKKPADFTIASPEDQGIYKMDLKTGKSEMILSYDTISKLPGFPTDVSEYYHWFNHLLVNPSSTRFIFLNRSRPVPSPDEMRDFVKENPDWRMPGFGSQYVTRAITANVDGSDLYALNDSGNFSHFIWKGDDVITAWAAAEDTRKAAFYEFPDKTKDYTMLSREAMPANGHNTYVPGTNYEWILNDTYPRTSKRLQDLYLYHVPSNRRVDLGAFHSPPVFKGEWRCDLHPRCDQAGKRVFFDSTHNGERRQMYWIDISSVVG